MPRFESCKFEREFQTPAASFRFLLPGHERTQGTLAAALVKSHHLLISHPSPSSTTIAQPSSTATSKFWCEKGLRPAPLSSFCRYQGGSATGAAFFLVRYCRRRMNPHTHTPTLLLLLVRCCCRRKNRHSSALLEENVELWTTW